MKPTKWALQRYLVGKWPAYLHKRNRIELPVTFSEWIAASLEGSGVKCMPLTSEIATKAALLPEIHRDPIDRFIIAEAIVENDTIFRINKQSA